MHFHVWLIIFLSFVNSKTLVHNGVRQRNSSLPIWQYIDQQIGSKSANMSLVLDFGTTMRRRRKWKNQRQKSGRTTTFLPSIASKNDTECILKACKNGSIL